jgi:hypothetical protein
MRKVNTDWKSKIVFFQNCFPLKNIRFLLTSTTTTNRNKLQSMTLIMLEWISSDAFRRQRGFCNFDHLKTWSSFLPKFDLIWQVGNEITLSKTAQPINIWCFGSCIYLAGKSLDKIQRLYLMKVPSLRI